MASSKTAERDARLARERLRRYNARQTVHAHKVKRRRRDNILALAVGALIIAVATYTQVLYLSEDSPAPAPTPSASAPEAGSNVGDIPAPELAEGRAWQGELVVNDIPLGFELDGAAAPQAVSAIIQQTRDGYFDGKSCHRLTVDGFHVLQCGSLDGTGAGDPNYRFGPIENAPADDVYPTGTIALARAGNDAYSNGHQFFVVYDDTTIPADSAGGYSVVGRITSGLDELIDQVVSGGVQEGGSSPTDGAPVVPTTITRMTLTE